ncbi:alpha/beta hydrolase [Geodermatophilus sp. TF02-6]|uniref:alpha/beta fold hydrolase n=1 Tax=Geodermatophilus sp. TF02-6 TaxID=2250575 RepID=UPI000DE9A74F|nr:alpha/beta hydrolase [Geodermatophilus sp. TF02-6]RBY81630.1 alpha/beta hydrolase [Geodermatophilus sp. TF02-6]
MDDVRTVGSGPHRVLALHGWFGSAQGWGQLPDYVDREAYTWVFPDQRGYGTRRDEPGEHTVAEVAADTLALADRLGWDRFSLVGHSMGAKYAQQVLVDAPGRVRRLVAVSGVAAGPTPFDDQGWGLFSGAPGDRGNRYAIIDLTTGNRLTPSFVEALVQHSLDASDADAFADYLTAWAKTDISEACADVAGRVPVRCIVGEHDPALGAETMRATWLQTHPDADLVVLANAGHYAMFETPAALVAAIEEFLGR